MMMGDDQPAMSSVFSSARAMKKGEKPPVVGAVGFVCKNCDEFFRWETDLSKHRRLYCKKKPFACPECGQLLSRRDSLRQHLRRHDGGKKFTCQYCDKLFDQRQNLKVHMRVHSGEKPFKCPECGRRFSQSQNLTTHLRVHSGEKPYKCVECKETFRFCSGFKNHLMRSHGITSTKTRPELNGLVQRQHQAVHRVSVIAKPSSRSVNSKNYNNTIFTCDTAKRDRCETPPGIQRHGNANGNKTPSIVYCSAGD